MNADQEQLLLKTKRFQVVQVSEPRRDTTDAVRQIIRHPGAVTILPDLGDGRICLIRNHRLSVGRELIELPAGTLEPNEIPVDCARRELKEETGYQAQHFRLLHTFYLSPGILDERMYLFLAEGLVPGNPSREPGEQIENVVVTFQEAIEMVRHGRIEDAKTMVGLLYYNRFVSQGAQASKESNSSTPGHS